MWPGKAACRPLAATRYHASLPPLYVIVSVRAALGSRLFNPEKRPAGADVLALPAGSGRILSSLATQVVDRELAFVFAW